MKTFGLIYSTKPKKDKFGINFNIALLAKNIAKGIIVQLETSACIEKNCRAKKDCKKALQQNSLQADFFLSKMEHRKERLRNL